MSGKNKCDTNNCKLCINNCIAESDHEFCAIFDYEYEELNSANAVNILMNPHYSVTKKRDIISTLKELGYSLEDTYKNGKIPTELIE